MNEDDTFTALQRSSFTEVIDRMVRAEPIFLNSRKSIHAMVSQEHKRFPDVDFAEWGMIPTMSEILQECNWTQYDFLKAVINDRG